MAEKILSSMQMDVSSDYLDAKEKQYTLKQVDMMNNFFTNKTSTVTEYSEYDLDELEGSDSQEDTRRAGSITMGVYNVPNTELTVYRTTVVRRFDDEKREKKISDLVTIITPSEDDSDLDSFVDEMFACVGLD